MHGTRWVRLETKRYVVKSMPAAAVVGACIERRRLVSVVSMISVVSGRQTRQWSMVSGWWVIVVSGQCRVCCRQSGRHCCRSTSVPRRPRLSAIRRRLSTGRNEFQRPIILNSTALA